MHFSFWKENGCKVILEIDLNPIWLFNTVLSLHIKDKINELGSSQRKHYIYILGARCQRKHYIYIYTH